MRRMLKQDDGAVAVIVAILLGLALLGLAAIVVDAGSLYSVKREFQNSADAAALAAVQDLPGNVGAADSAAQVYADQNARHTLTSVQAAFGADQGSGPESVTVTVDGIAPLGFAQIWGMTQSPIRAKASAAVQSPTGYGRRVMPFGIMSKEPSGSAPFGYVFNEQVMLKQAPPDGEAGNFQFLSLTDPPGEHVGANLINEALANGGVDVEVFINELYSTRTGLNGRQIIRNLIDWIGADTCTFDEVATIDPDDGTVRIHDYACHRLIVCPIIVDPGPPVAYNWNELNGTSQPVQVISFAWFFIEDWGSDTQLGAGTGNDCWISGRFIRPLSPEDATEWGPVDPLGAIGFRLTD